MRILISAFLLFSSFAVADDFIFGNSGTSPAILVLNGGAFSVDTSVNPVTAGHDFNQGWWSATFDNSVENTNFFTGSFGVDVLNNFFAFDLRGLSGPATTATLQIDCGDCSSLGLFPKTYNLWDVTTSVSSLTNINGTNGAIANDLASGISYGVVGISSNPTSLSIVLNPAALAAINAAVGNGYFAVGGSLSPSSVPEPSTYALLGLGLVAGAGLKRFRKR